MLDQVFGADDVGAGGLGFFSLGAAREHGDLERATGAVRQVADAAHHLVGVLRVDAEVHGDLDGLVELRLGALLDQLHGVIDVVGFRRVDAFAVGEALLPPASAGGLDLLWCCFAMA